jgi:hypothetical protein
MVCKRSTVALFVLCCVSPGSAARTADNSDPSRIAIIDASLNTKPYLDVLHSAGVKVIGRYFARCAQPEYPGVQEKRLIDNAGEADAILGHKAAFGVLSIYQYYNNSPKKFEGIGELPFRKGKRDPRCSPDDDIKVLVTLPGSDCKMLPIYDCREVGASKPHDATTEAELDARAAIVQAKRVGQPPNTAIYFGADFDSLGITETQLNNMRTYFTKVKEILTLGGYLLGAYGDGKTLEHLTGMIDLKWISPSPAFNGTTAFYNFGQWDLFQNAVDIKWKLAAGQLEIDGNVQGIAAAAKYVGFWTKSGQYSIDANHNKAISDRRRFVCNGSAKVYQTPSALPENLVKHQRCDVLHFDVSRSVRIGAVTSADGKFIEVDCDEDGTFDGWTLRSNLSKSFADRPEYKTAKPDRARQVCP